MSGLTSPQTLVEYRVLQMPHIEPRLKHRPQDVLRNIETLVQGISNEPLEIVGNVPLFFLLPFFWKVRNIATEVVYQQKPPRPAYVISSFLEEDVIRPVSVVSDLLYLNQMVFPAGNSKESDSDSILDRSVTIDLASAWSHAQGKTGKDKITSMLSNVYALTAAASLVELHGEIAEIPALACVNMLAVMNKHVMYEKIDFQKL